jgi:hypothetical protein
MNRDLLSSTRWRSRSRSFGCGFIDFDVASRPPHGFLGLFLRSRVGSCFPFAGSSLLSTGTSSDGWVTHGLIARRPGQNWDYQNQDVTIKAGEGRDIAIQSLHSNEQDLKFQEDNHIDKDKGALPGPFQPRYGRSAPAH